jgi:trehalose synthase
VLNLSATAFHTDAADLLAATVPLMRDLGIDADWQVVRGTEACRVVNATLYRALAGSTVYWTSQMDRTWAKCSAMNASLFDQDYDFVVVHDPQPLGILAELRRMNSHHSHSHWIWHCHLDLTKAQPEVLRILRPHVEGFDVVVFQAEDFFRPDLGAHRAAIIRPAVDPLGPRNMELSSEAVNCLLHSHGIDPRRPIISQFSSFDRWHDPLGTLQAYRAAKHRVPDLQLVLVGQVNSSDHDGRIYFELLAEHAAADPDIHIFSTLDHFGAVESNIIQRASSVVVQRAMRKGFGFDLADAQWKGRAVVVGHDGLAPSHIADGVTGFLADDLETYSEKIVYCLLHPEEAERLGQAGREHIRQHFLITRHLVDQLKLFQSLATASYREAVREIVTQNLTPADQELLTVSKP